MFRKSYIAETVPSAGLAARKHQRTLRFLLVLIFVLLISLSLGSNQIQAQVLPCFTNPFGLTDAQKDAYEEGRSYISVLVDHADLFDAITTTNSLPIFELNQTGANWLRNQNHCQLYDATPQEILDNLGTNRTPQEIADTIIILGENLMEEPNGTVEAMEQAQRIYEAIETGITLVNFVFFGAFPELPEIIFSEFFIDPLWDIYFDFGLAGDVQEEAQAINEYLTLPFEVPAVGVSNIGSAPASLLDGGWCQATYGTTQPMYRVALIGNANDEEPDATAWGYFNLFKDGSEVSFVLGLQNMAPFFGDGIIPDHTDYVIVLLEYTDTNHDQRLERILLQNTQTPGLGICVVGRTELPEIQLGSEVEVRYLFIEDGHLDTRFDADGVQSPIPAPHSLCYGACGVFNYPPHPPSTPVPPNGANQLGTSVTLNWTGSDPDGDSLTYDVYFETVDTSPDVLVASDQSGTSFNPGTLAANTRYYWQIVVRDPLGLTAISPVWYFDTGASPFPATRSEDAKVTRGSGGFFGTAVDASSGWDRIVVGASNQSSGGTVYVMQWINGAFWQEQTHFVASDTGDFDYLGTSLEMVNDRMVVGAPGLIQGWGGVGHAYIFDWNGTSWVEQANLTASDGTATDTFGQSVAINDAQNVVAVGAPFDDNGVSNSGSVYIFEWNGTIWNVYPALQATPPIAEDKFGWSVDLNAAGDTLVVASFSATYVFERQGNDWVQVAVLSGSSDAVIAGSTILAGPEVYHYNGASWVHQQTLTASDGVPGDGFGGAVDLNDAGTVAVVGASGSNSAYVFTYNGFTWNQQAKLIPSDGASDDAFGYSVTVVDSMVAVGSRFYGSPSTGAVYVYDIQDIVDTPSTVGFITDAIGSGDFGEAVDVDLAGDTILVGAPWHQAYIYEFDGNNWIQQAELTPSTWSSYQMFGSAVALDVDGDTAVVGSPFYETAYKPGVAYIYKRSGTNWTEEAILYPLGSANGDEFGAAVDINATGDVIVVGRPYGGIGYGTAHVFVREGEFWVPQATLQPATSSLNFGSSVAINAVGDTIVVGNGASAANVFTWNGTQWVEQQELITSDIFAYRFGDSVDINAAGDVILVGAPGARPLSILEKVGAAYVFALNAGAWSEQARLRPMVGAEFDYFGQSVSLNAPGDRIIVGSSGFDNAIGAAYLFAFDGSSWHQTDRLVDLNGTSSDRGGQGVGLGANTVVVGVPDRDGGGAINIYRGNFASAPIAAFSAHPTLGDAPLPVQFLNQSSGEITQYVWDLGDGTRSVDPEPTHVYLYPGHYTVVLWAIGPGGMHAAATSVTVEESDTIPPTGPTSINSASHTIGVTSLDNTLDIAWSSDAADTGGSGLAGYSVLWDNAPNSDPDAIVEYAFNVFNATSSVLANGAWYVHLCACDNAGNCGPALHLGPFVVDAPDVPMIEYDALAALYNNTGGPNWTNNTDWLATTAVCSWHGIQCVNGHVDRLHLAGNNLIGTIPAEFGDLAHLTMVTLAGNQLNGPIPDSIGNLASLTYLSLEGNDLDGTIPDTISSLNTNSLYLSNNKLTGPIPPGIRSWGIIDLSGNQLTGSIPTTLGSLTNMQALMLGRNKLEGSIPSELGSLVNLMTLDLNSNQLSGEIPTTLTNLIDLSIVFDIGYNMLTTSDPTLITFLDIKDPDWADTQTVPPTELAGANHTPTSVDLTWTPILYTADGGFYETSYATDPGGPWTVIGQTAGKTVDRFSVTGLTPGLPYYFRIRTYTPAHAGGQQNDLWSNYSSVLTHDIAWTIITEQEMFTELESQTNNTGGHIAFALVDCVPDGLHFTVVLDDGTPGEVSASVIDPGMGYITIQLDAVTVDGLSAPEAFVDVVYTELPALLVDSLNALLSQKMGLDFDLDSLSVLDSGIYALGTGGSTAPLAPSSLIVTSVTEMQIDLNWSDHSGDETAFLIERSLDGASWTQVGTVGADVTAYADTSLTCGTTYYYRAQAFRDVDGHYSDYSNTATGVTQLCPLNAPLGLTVLSVGLFQVDLNWTDTASDETAFYIERSLDGSIWTPIGIAGVDTTAYSDTTVDYDTTYYYRVCAYRSGDGVYSLYSNTLQVTTEDFPMSPSLIAFQSDRTGDWDVYTMNLDGSIQTNLTNNPGFDDANPSWSPDGTRILFNSNRDGDSDIYVMDVDGNNVTNLTNTAFNDYQPSWSADGTKIVFGSDRDGNAEIYVMNADGGAQTRLTDNAFVDQMPSLSPDGTQITFHSDRDGNYEVYVMDAAGGGQTRLTTHTANDIDPEWSPDGTEIAFFSYRDGQSEVYAIKPDGTGLRRVTSYSPNDYEPSWSPDGTQMVLSSYRGSVREIYIVNAADGSGRVALTNNSSHDRYPSWQPITVQPLAVPSNLTATLVSQSPTQVDLIWSDNTTDETAFYVESSPDGINWTQVAIVSAGQTTYQDETTLSCDQTRYYRVRAYRSSDGMYSHSSNIESVTSLCLHPAIWSTTPGTRPGA